MNPNQALRMFALWVLGVCLSSAKEISERNHRLQMDPVVSFLIQGIEGVYEYHVPGTYLTFDVPFTLGYNTKLYAEDGRILTTGGGLGVNKFLNAESTGSHINLHAHFKLFNTKWKRITVDGWEDQRQSSSLLYFSLMWGYRWQSTQNGFLVNLNLGPSYLIIKDFSSSGDNGFQGLVPMAQIALGYAIF